MTLTIATVNVNGLRAAARKGMGDWLAGTDADVITLQEVRAPDELLASLVGDGWRIEGEASALKGRAGVAIAARVAREDVDLDGVRRGVGLDGDAHTGRWLEVDLPDPFADGRALTVVSLYMHSGNTEKPQTMADKYAFLDRMLERLGALRADGRHVLVTGDLNIAHTERDIKNWKGNLKSAGFLPAERAYLDRLTGEEGGFVDVHRTLAGDVAGPYTWWSQRGKAYDNDSGWRIDYQLATPDLAARAVTATVDRAPSYDTRWSDHAPLIVRYE